MKQAQCHCQSGGALQFWCWGWLVFSAAWLLDQVMFEAESWKALQSHTNLQFSLHAAFIVPHLTQFSIKYKNLPFTVITAAGAYVLNLQPLFGVTRISQATNTALWLPQLTLAQWASSCCSKKTHILLFSYHLECWKHNNTTGYHLFCKWKLLPLMWHVDAEIFDL